MGVVTNHITHHISKVECFLRKLSRENVTWKYNDDKKYIAVVSVGSDGWPHRIDMSFSHVKRMSDDEMEEFIVSLKLEKLWG
jgi:hypothetical protein